MTHRSLLQLFLEISWLSAALMLPIVTGSPHPTPNALLSKYRLIVSVLDSHYCQSLNSCPLSSAIWNYSKGEEAYERSNDHEEVVCTRTTRGTPHPIYSMDGSHPHQFFSAEAKTCPCEQRGGRPPRSLWFYLDHASYLPSSNS